MGIKLERSSDFKSDVGFWIQAPPLSMDYVQGAELMGKKRSAVAR